MPNFKILGQVVPENSLTEKKVYTHTNTHTEKAKTIYPLYTSYTGGIIILSQVVAEKSLTEDLCIHYIGVRAGKIENVKKKEK